MNTYHAKLRKPGTSSGFDTVFSPLLANRSGSEWPASANPCRSFGQDGGLLTVILGCRRRLLVLDFARTGFAENFGCSGPPPGLFKPYKMQQMESIKATLSKLHTDKHCKS